MYTSVICPTPTKPTWTKVQGSEGVRVQHLVDLILLVLWWACIIYFKEYRRNEDGGQIPWQHHHQLSTTDLILILSRNRTKFLLPNTRYRVFNHKSTLTIHIHTIIHFFWLHSYLNQLFNLTSIVEWFWIVCRKVFVRATLVCFDENSSLIRLLSSWTQIWVTNQVKFKYLDTRLKQFVSLLNLYIHIYTRI